MRDTYKPSMWRKQPQVNIATRGRFNAGTLEAALARVNALQGLPDSYKPVPGALALKRDYKTITRYTDNKGAAVQLFASDSKPHLLAFLQGYELALTHCKEA